MTTLLPIVGLLVGLGLLVVAADTFVGAAELLAVRRRWSPAVIGAVIVGFGTSLPELVTSVLAAFGGEPDIAVGNAAGSNVANLTLILGLAALVAPLRPGRDRPRRDAVVATIASVLLVLASLGGVVGTVEATVLVVAILAVTTWQALAGRTEHLEVTIDAAASHLGLRVVGGLVGVLAGAQLLVWGATEVATRFGVPSIVIGSVLVAVGTSLPELATAIASARRGQTELLVGNLLGSNAFNALAVVGVAGLVARARGVPLEVATPAFAVVVAAGVVTVAVGAWLAWRPSVPRWAGGLLVAAYVAAVPALLRIG